uniref:Minor tail protein n=1 Tax=Siphoviridae sp. ct2hZ16 TaxID=2826276 RepID=A0A8S5QTZ7_9CAUD|nr:MAG TPA: minor tail protein [Siphoviridae sp. ct2hZ16]
MSNVAAISGATGEQLEQLTELAKEMGATTKFSASEAAEGYQYMAMAGWKTQDMLNGLPGIMNLAAASGENLGTVSDIVTDALTAMGLSAEDSAHFANVLAAASSNSNTNVSMMGETFKYAAPLAGSLGYNIEDLAQAIGLMANSGIKGSQAGTSLRSILTRLASPPKDCAEAMEEYGIAMTNSDGSMRSLMEVMENMRDSLGNLDAQQQAAAASAIGGQEAMSGLLAIVNASEDDFGKLAAAIDSAEENGGSAANMAKTMQDNLQGSLTILKSALEGVGIAAFEKFQEPLKNAVDKVAEAVGSFDLEAFLQKLKDVFEVAKQFAPVVTAVVGALGTLYGIFKAMEIIDKVKNSVLLLNAAFAANPLVFFIALLAGVVTALMTLYNTNENFRNKVNEIWNAIVKFVSGAVDALINFFTVTIPEGIQAAIDWFKSLPEKVAEFFSKLPETIGYYIGLALANILIWAMELPQRAREAASNFINGVIEFFTTLPGKVADFLRDVIENVIQWGADLIENGRQAISDFVESVVEGVKELPSKILEVGKNVAKSFVEGLKSMGSWVKEQVGNFASGASSGFSGAFGNSNRRHAGGLDYVPYNDYVANLHRGEMVLTAREADEYRKNGVQGGTGFVVNQTIYAAKQTPVELAAATRAAFQRARWATV